MPIPKPHESEDQNRYVSRCIQMLRGEGKPREQAAAICHTAWRERLQKNLLDDLGAVRKQCEDMNADASDQRTHGTDEDS